MLRERLLALRGLTDWRTCAQWLERQMQPEDVPLYLLILLIAFAIIQASVLLGSWSP